MYVLMCVWGISPKTNAVFTPKKARFSKSEISKTMVTVYPHGYEKYSICNNVKSAKYGILSVDDQKSLYIF